MIEHVRALGVVSLVRALLEAAFGIYVLKLASVWSRGEGFFLLHGAPEDGDRGFFLGLAIVLLVAATVRAAQAIASFLLREWSRRVGIALGILDVVLPITLPVALWSFVVYRHPETRDRFRRASGARA
ncbi:MAG TPA: hypothetical protein VK116_07230 [Planctomycetota bacterium]|nr:hypothetical protein [Planctomycetota bacterium]